MKVSKVNITHSIMELAFWKGRGQYTNTFVVHQKTKKSYKEI